MRAGIYQTKGIDLCLCLCVCIVCVCDFLERQRGQGDFCIFDPARGGVENIEVGTKK